MTGLAIAAGAAADIPNHVDVAGGTLSRITTTLFAAACVFSFVGLLLPAAGGSKKREPVIGRARLLSVPLLLFLGLGLVGLARVPSTEGFQNVAVYFGFYAVMVITAARSSQHTPTRVTRWMVVAGWLLIGLYSIVLMLHGLGGESFLGNRGAPITLLVFMATVAPLARSRSNWWARWLPWAGLLIIGASLSRTALAAGVVVLIAVGLRRPGVRVARVAVAATLGSLALYQAVLHVRPLHDRFVGGDLGAQVHGFALNTSGRVVVWRPLYDHIKEHWLLGYGPGTAATYVRNTVRLIGQPHNDYLRIWHDFGVVGLALWVLALGAILTRLISGARRAQAQETAQLKWSAAFAVMAIMVIMITDNAVIYPFVMWPLAALIGIALAEGTSPVDLRPAEPNVEAPKVGLRRDHVTSGRRPSLSG